MELWSPHLWTCWWISYLLRLYVALILLLLHKNLSSLSPRCTSLDWYLTVKHVVYAWWGRLVCDLYRSGKKLSRAQNAYRETIMPPSKKGCKIFPWTCHLNCGNSISRVLQQNEGFPFFFFLPVDLVCLKWIHQTSYLQGHEQIPLEELVLWPFV